MLYDASRAVTPQFYRAPCPEGKTPFEYQFAGVEYGLARDHHLFGDAPGLGKTIQAILLANALGNQRVLVVCPASLRLNWEREVWAWSTIPNVSTYPVIKGSDGISTTANYVIISYDLLRNASLLRAIMALRWDHLILDEAHALKDPAGNKRTRVICAPNMLPSVCGRITMLSGTILPNQPVEIYNAARLLCWDSIDRASLEDFREKYYGRGEGFIFGSVIKDGVRVFKRHWSDNVRNVPRNLDDLQARVRKHFMVRRLKKDVITELPEKQWHFVPLSSDAGIRKALDHPGWAKVEKLHEMEGENIQSGMIDGQIGTARRLLGEAKVPAVLSYIRELMEEGVEKLLVGAWHLSVLAMLRAGLEKYGLVYMDGSTPLRRRQEAVDRFQKDESVRIILGQVKAIGEGWTLTAAQDAVLAEPDWVPGVNEQFIDRLHRIGQRGNVLGHVPVVEGTIDAKILAKVIQKDKNIFLALDHIS